jgi:hypothetical protein
LYGLQCFTLHLLQHAGRNVVHTVLFIKILNTWTLRILHGMAVHDEDPRLATELV